MSWFSETLPGRSPALIDFLLRRVLSYDSSAPPLSTQIAVLHAARGVSPPMDRVTFSLDEDPIHETLQMLVYPVTFPWTKSTSVGEHRSAEGDFMAWDGHPGTEPRAYIEEQRIENWRWIEPLCVEYTSQYLAAWIPDSVIIIVDLHQLC